MYILIGADLVPTSSNAELFRAGDADGLLGAELCDIMQAASYRMFNLEVPLTDTETPIDKCGPCLIASTDTVGAYKAMGVDLLTLANNHILDQDVQGLRSTLDVLDENKIAYVGIGNDPIDAAKPYLFDFGGRKIGVYACAEHEFSIVNEKAPGANPFDALETPDHIAELKKKCDFVVVLYHGGKEHYRYPSPDLQKICRKLVEKGADLVVCQHSHCIGCEERYLNGTIVYGQGNFLFDYSNSEYWQTSLLVKIEDDLKITYIPLKKQGSAVGVASGEDAEAILNGFAKRSEEIKQDGFIQAEYDKFAETMINGYLFALSGKRKSFFFRAINKLSGYRYAQWYVKRRYKKENLLAIRNFIECEAHREVLLKSLND